MNIYDFTVKDIDGNEVNLQKFKGKVMLVVNTASACGFTPQFEGLELLYQKYKDQGLVILGFPCNQFKNQDSGTNEEIKTFCTLNYGVTFPMFEKIEVNGKDAHPIYKFLKSKKSGILGNKIKWNFTKFLIDREGNVVERYAPTTKPEDFDADILQLLNKI
ncbi:MAG: glutathione peroxidase [Peptoniphilaceae bacterium]|uniref:glutathione peroxidase n=1 Tax=Parvimonas sp. TaxID=1944660 RepID=UPI0025E6C35B|nr:glutathione peroxidase [Parvimonas sp.]MCI5996736.1 glutathione peroxidase [Parvimonas sp.]MDD7764519.1 glutathione peroxidase [Peptoniphilaceae bacterium]MDY3050463.1 glutathione peroxidase [Parvimonas sp.]